MAKLISVRAHTRGGRPVRGYQRAQLNSSDMTRRVIRQARRDYPSEVRNRGLAAVVSLPKRQAKQSKLTVRRLDRRMRKLRTRVDKRSRVSQ